MTYKALVLFSGGMDSFISIKLLQEQGIDVTAVYFSSPFMTSNIKGIEEKAKAGGFKLREIKIADDYIELLKNPPHDFGKNANPCIDCHAYMFKRVKKVMEKEGYDFIATGEVLGQRPKSQRKKELGIVAEEAGLTGKLLRPMSAKLLEETEVEKKGIVDRSKLLDVNGRTRTRQIEIMKGYGFDQWANSGGGCLLTDPGYGRKVKALIKIDKVSLKNLEIIKYGRLFIKEKNIIMVGRNQENNEMLEKLKGEEDYIFQVANDVPGPVTLLQGLKTEEMIKLAASLTLKHSNYKEDEMDVVYDKGSIKVSKISDEEIKEIRV